MKQYELELKEIDFLLRKEKKCKRRKIGYLRLSGTLNFSSDSRRHTNPLLTLINSLSENLRYKGKQEEYHTFTSGRIYPLNVIRKGRKVNLIVEFKSARPRFMDLLVNKVLNQSDKCSMSFSLRGETINFNTLRELMGLEDTNIKIQSHKYENFEGVYPIDETPIKIAAIPRPPI